MRSATGRAPLKNSLRRQACRISVSPEPFGIYVHWPYCAAKCPYCDFNSHVRQRIDEPQWLDLIERELSRIAGMQHQGPVVRTVFFGGGTPSLMRDRAVGMVLNASSNLRS